MRHTGQSSQMCPSLSYHCQRQTPVTLQAFEAFEGEKVKEYNTSSAEVLQTIEVFED